MKMPDAWIDRHSDIMQVTCNYKFEGEGGIPDNVAFSQNCTGQIHNR